MVEDRGAAGMNLLAVTDDETMVDSGIALFADFLGCAAVVEAAIVGHVHFHVECLALGSSGDGGAKAKKKLLRDSNP